MDSPQLPIPQDVLIRRFRVLAAALVVFYVFGLTRELSEPWVGLHDWNGAFFSQLARNLLRYPFDIHDGIPLVAAGSKAPPADERSLYATHPPGLVWLLALVVRGFGESELTARMVPVLFSIASVVLLLHLWQTAHGRRFTMFAGAFFAAMPMAVYFGRMVDHEALCLFFMLAASAAYVRSTRDDSRMCTRSLAAVGLILAIGCWFGWAMCLFAAIFAMCLLWQARRREHGAKRPMGAALVVCILIAISVIAMLIYIVHAGLDGSWSNLASVFFSRATDSRGDAPRASLAAGGDVWQHTLDNFTWPLLVLAAIGLIDVAIDFKLGRFAVTRSHGNGDASNTIAGDHPAAIAARRCLFLITLTGAIWMIAFPRQYTFHHYWPYYLGPAVAALAARAIGLLARQVRFASSRSALVAIGAITVSTMVIEIRGQRRYFADEETALTRFVEACRIIRDMTAPGDRLVTFWDPTWTERRGNYVFRNIVPPQFAFYTDRAFTVERDAERVIALAETHELFVIPVADAVKFSGSLRPLRERFDEQLVADSIVVFDLRRPKTADRGIASASASQPNN